MINRIKGQLQKFIGLQETYPTFTKELARYSEHINRNSSFSSRAEIDIIMPTFNRVSVTKRCIENLLKTTKVKFNLIIIDNNSDSKTKTYLKSIVSKQIKVIFLSNNLGGSGSRMEGLKFASTDYVAFVDNDIYTMPFYFENLIKTLDENIDISAVQSKVIYPNKLIQVNRPTFTIEEDWITFNDKDLDKSYKDNESETSELINWLPSGATLWRKSVFENEGFDLDFNTSYEDNDFSYSLHQKGYKFMNNHKAICLHLSSQFTPSSVSDVYTKGRFDKGIVINSLKQFKKKHGLYLSFGDKEKFAKYMGFESSKELTNSL
ncbi:MAG: glycosyltransferase family 2 protein [Candidatus Dojkabacteria bacterium]